MGGLSCRCGKRRAFSSERVKFVYPLCRFGDEFATIDSVSAMRRTTEALGLPVDSSRPRLKLHAALIAGALQAYIHRMGTSDFHRIPLQHWRARPRSAARLAPYVIWPVDTVPEFLVGGALAFRENEFAEWLACIVKPDSDLHGNSSVREVGPSRTDDRPRLGRRKNVGGFAKADAPLVARMRVMIEADEASGPYAAAQAVAPSAQGASEPSKIRRLERRYSETFPSSA